MANTMIVTAINTSSIVNSRLTRNACIYYLLSHDRCGQRSERSDLDVICPLPRIGGASWDARKIPESCLGVNWR